MDQQAIINLITERLDTLRRILKTEGDHVTDEGEENITVRIRELINIRHLILTTSLKRH